MKELPGQTGWIPRAFWNTASLLQSAAFMISLVVMPAAAAADALALLIEWALNISVSTPAFPSSPFSPFSHLAMVDELTGLCGLGIMWCDFP